MVSHPAPSATFREAATAWFGHLGGRPVHRQIFQCLVNRISRNGAVYISHAAIADAAGVHRKTVTRRLQDPIWDGVILRIKRTRTVDGERRRQADCYILEGLPEWIWGLWALGQAAVRRIAKLKKRMMRFARETAERGLARALPGRSHLRSSESLTPHQLLERRRRRQRLTPQEGST